MNGKFLTHEEFRAKRLKEKAARMAKATPFKEKKKASVTAYRQLIDIASKAVYSVGIYDPKGYNQFHPAEMSAFDLGKEAHMALQASRFITDGHPDWHWYLNYPENNESQELEDLLKAQAGVKTRKALFNGAGYVALTLQDGEIKVMPWRYRGQGHWEGIRGLQATVLPQAASNAEFGAAIHTAIAVSRDA